MNDVEKYINGVIDESIIACKWVKLCVKRHLDDLEKSRDENYEYYFDEKAADVVIRFKELLKHSKGKWAGTFFRMQPWQKFITWVLYGWKRKSDNTRRFRKAYIEIARKNGKTFTAAADGLYMFCADGEKGAECYTAATKLDQAKLSHSAAEMMVKSNSSLRDIIRIYKNNLNIEEYGSKYEPLGSDYNTLDGLNPHFALIDEYHAHQNSKILDVLDSGMGARSQPLLMIITTAGFEKDCACYEERTQITKILDGTIENDTIFGIIFTIDEGDDWKDPNIWQKANPNLGVSVMKDWLEKQIKEAIDSPTKQNNVLTKNLNIWTQATTRWILQEKWLENCIHVDIENLKGRTCFCGLDLSANIDITAYTLCFPKEDDADKYKMISRFFLPESGIYEKSLKDGVPYDQWARDGYIILTPGNIIDYEYIIHRILEDAQDFYIQEVAYDPYNATHLATRLQDEGLTMVKFFQGYRYLSPAAKDFEAKVLRKELALNNNPVLNWMMSCTEVVSDASGNIKPVKPDRAKSKKRIDGIISSIMALDRAVRNQDSIYKERGITFL